MFAEILRTKKNIFEDRKREYLDIIQSECNRLNRLINNVLDFSKIERGIAGYKFVIFDMKKSMESVIREMEHQLHMQKFDFSFEYDENDYSYHGDADAVMICFINLINNAMKYSKDEKSINIKMSDTNNEICVAVSDKGIGIPDEHKDNIFEPFFRPDIPEVKSTGGAGIGLSLVKSIMNAHNGRIVMETLPGKGTTFYLYFPKGAQHE